MQTSRANFESSSNPEANFGEANFGGNQLLHGSVSLSPLYLKFLKSDGGGGLVHFGTLSEPRGQLVLECVCVDSVPSCVYEFVKFLKSDGGGGAFRDPLGTERAVGVGMCMCR